MIILSLGSNLKSKFGNRFDNLIYAMSFLEEKGVKIDKRSSFFETPSYPDKKNPKFINIVISINTNLSINNLIDLIIFTEEKLGRKRIRKNDPRTCDIDIIDYKNEVLNFEYKKSFFSIPHGQLSKRNFVLYPLKEILPDWKHPKTKESIDSLIQKLSDDDGKSILKVKKNWYS